jgi:thiamine biosynthesis lipoprotein
MASPCEVLLRSTDDIFCQSIAELAVKETQRIEQKFSRYLQDSLVHGMNNSNGILVNIDQETFQLLEYSRNLFELSGGLFDITSGVLRKIWNFSKGSKPPNQKQISALIENIDFRKLDYDQSSFSMPKNMEIDFGGIGKEYAVDQVGKIIENRCSEEKAAFLVNFGGDIVTQAFLVSDLEWTIGVEQENALKERRQLIKIRYGAVATSGNSKRFFDYNGRRYGHLFNPKTGYPIENAPLSVTTFSGSCVLAGSFSSLAMLQGADAEKFLQEQGIKYICNR